MDSNLKACSTCKEEKGINEFQLDNGKPRARCKSCCNSIRQGKKKANEALQKELAGELRVCNVCNIEKINNDFYKTANADPFTKTCKTCKNRIRKEKNNSNELEDVTESFEIVKIVSNLRKCTKCGVKKEIGEFALSNGRPRGDCKWCCNEISKAKRLAEKKALAEIQIVKTETSQVCLLCNEEKEFSQYDIIYGKIRTHCILCYENLPTLSPISVKRELELERSRKRYDNRSEEQKEDKKNKASVYYVNNKETINKQHAEYRANNPEKEKIRHAKFFQENKEEILIYRKEYFKKYPIKKLMLNIRSRLRHSYISGSECYDLIGCDMDFLKRWFIFHFELDKDKDINFSNHGSRWHLDHVIPCRIFDASITSEKEQCFHWSNLRPLLIKENLSKNGKISEEHISIQNTRLQEFCKQENIPIRQIEIPTKMQDCSIEEINSQSEPYDLDNPYLDSDSETDCDLVSE
jgi:hypothetical protein